MALLHNTTGQSAHPSDASSFSAGSPVSHAFKRASLKLVGVALFIALCAVLFAASTASGSKDNSALQKDKTTASQPDTHVTITSQSSKNPVLASQSIESHVQSTLTPSTNAMTSPVVQVTVNGQNIPVPHNGTVQKTVTSPDGSTSLSVSTNTTGNGNDSSFSSSSLNVSTNSSSFTNDYSSNQMNGAPVYQQTP